MTAKDLRARALEWITNDPDQTTAAELRALLDEGRERELAERMSGPLRFGTAGLRGIIGAGESRMNTAVILRTTAGLAKYLHGAAHDVGRRGVVVGFDGRHHSRAFAGAVARVLAGAGIPAHLFTEMAPTPLTAFAIGELGASAGVMITASHNPPEYNGYKVYWSNGALITPPHDDGIASAIDEVGAAGHIPQLEMAEAEDQGLLHEIPPSLIERYFDAVAELSVDDRGRDDLSIVYTAMHGVGDRFTRTALERFGFERVWSVAAQQDPDGGFPTVRYPNPEEEGALDLAMALAREKKAQLVLANDPDADRLAVAIPTSEGDYRQLSGNEVGVLLGEYVLRKMTRGEDRRLFVTTVVSSPMLGDIARRSGVRYAEVLTGFKWIVTTALDIEEKTGARFAFGYEEALGYTIGDVTPDKDGISAAAVFAELTAVAASEGRTIDDELERLSRTYGLYMSAQRSVSKGGTRGAKVIADTMNRLRKHPPETIGDASVKTVRDFLTEGASTGRSSETYLLPRANVVAFDLEGDARVVARPSGTEPKIKYYFDLREAVGDDEPYAAAVARARRRLDALISAFIDIAG